MEIFLNTLKKFISVVYERIISGSGFSKGEISSIIAELMNEENMNFFTFDSINALMYALKKLAHEKARPEETAEVTLIFEKMFRSVALQFAEESHNIEKRMVADRFVFGRIAADSAVNYIK